MTRNKGILIASTVTIAASLMLAIKYLIHKWGSEVTENIYDIPDKFERNDESKDDNEEPAIGI